MTEAALLLLSAALLAAQVSSLALNYRGGHVALARGARQHVKDVVIANFAILSFRSNSYTECRNSGSD